MEKIVVIGAWIMGASLAYALAGTGRDVVDGGLPASGASGRSFGWINASFFLSRTFRSATGRDRGAWALDA